MKYNILIYMKNNNNKKKIEVNLISIHQVNSHKTFNKTVHKVSWINSNIKLIFYVNILINHII